MGHWLNDYKTFTPGESQINVNSTNNRIDSQDQMDLDNFLNTQLNTFHSNRNIEINAIDNNIEHLPNTDILDIITGDVFSFATHNVRGMNDDIKCKQIIDTFRIKKTDFISLTETNHKSSMFFKYKNDPNFVSFWSKPDPNDSPAAGVGLLINKK